MSTSTAAGRLIILTYHRVLPSPDELFPEVTDARTLARHAKILNRFFRVMPLADAVGRLGEGSLPSRAVCITFDDGYLDNYTVAVPILEKYGLSATIFVATGFLAGGRMWNDTVIESIRRSVATELDLRDMGLGSWPLDTPAKRADTISSILGKLKYLETADRDQAVRQIARIAGGRLPGRLMMDETQVCDLHRRGITIGAHTVSHPILTSLSPREAEDEITGSRKFLSSLLDADVDLFAYPNGKPKTDYDRSHVEQVRQAGFRYAVSTALGPAAADSDGLQLPRIGPWDRSAWLFGLRLLRWFSDDPPTSVQRSAARR